MDERTRELIQTRVLKRIKDVPSLPQFVIETLKKLDDPSTSASDVAASLAKDEGLVMRVLKLANSAFYGLPRKVSSVTEAVALLGFKAIRGILLAASVYPFVGGSFAGYALDRGELWRHSLGVAYISRYLAQRMNNGDPEESYVGGMLHDVGKIVLNEYVRFGYSLIAKLTEEERVPFMEAERTILGFDHAEVGGLVIAQWNLPEAYACAARFHHEPEALPHDEAEHRSIVDRVHLANVICLMLGFGLGVDGLQYPVAPGVLERMGIKDLEPVMSEAVEILTALDEEIKLE